MIIKQSGGAAGGGGAARCSRLCGGRSRSEGMEPVDAGQLLWSAAGEHVCLRDEEAAPQSQSGNQDKPGRSGPSRVKPARCFLYRGINTEWCCDTGPAAPITDNYRPAGTLSDQWQSIILISDPECKWSVIIVKYIMITFCCCCAATRCWLTDISTCWCINATVLSAQLRYILEFVFDIWASQIKLYIWML